MKVLIPSKDRTAQLDLLLYTIDRFAPQLEPVVLYKVSSEDYRAGYEKVKRLHSVEFREEGNFYDDFYNFLDGVTNEFGLFTDDCIIFKDTGEISVEENIWCFSLRLGYNTLVQNYVTGAQQRQMQPNYINSDRIVWEWKRYRHSENYGVPFSWDGCFYNKELFMSVLNGEKFLKTDNQDAIPLQRIEWWFNNMGIMPPLMSSYLDSRVVCQNINDTHGRSRAGVSFGISNEKLNKYFIEGKRIDFSSMDFSDVNACHMEIPFNLK